MLSDLSARVCHKAKSLSSLKVDLGSVGGLAQGKLGSNLTLKPNSKMMFRLDEEDNVYKAKLFLKIDEKRVRNSVSVLFTYSRDKQTKTADKNKQTGTSKSAEVIDLANNDDSDDEVQIVTGPEPLSPFHLFLNEMFVQMISSNYKDLPRPTRPWRPITACLIRNAVLSKPTGLAQR